MPHIYYRHDDRTINYWPCTIYYILFKCSMCCGIQRLQAHANPLYNSSFQKAHANILWICCRVTDKSSNAYQKNNICDCTLHFYRALDIEYDVLHFSYGFLWNFTPAFTRASYIRTAIYMAIRSRDESPCEPDSWPDIWPNTLRLYNDIHEEHTWTTAIFS